MLWSLHGFLGEGADWAPFETSFQSVGQKVRKLDLFRTPPQESDLVSWGRRFSEEVAKEDPSPFLIGYSLGGRLALHALFAEPNLWRGGVIISSHLGITNPHEKRARIASDEMWAERFHGDKWEKVVSDWNRQPVFGGKSTLAPRVESHFSRPALSFALKEWSLGKQEAIIEDLAKISCPVLWVAGEHDERYVTQAKMAIAQLPRGELWIAPKSYHRVPWEKQQAFEGRVVTFLKERR